MSRTILSRLGAGVVATALVAGGSLLVAAPASAANDIVTPNSVVENTWGTEGGLTVSGTGTAGDDLVVDITDNNVGEFDYFVNDSKDVEVGADGTYTVTFFWNEEQNDFTRLPQVGDTPFAYIQNVTEGSEVGDIFLPIAVTAFVPAAQNVVVDPICLSGDAVRDPGVTVFATGFGQGEEVTYVVTDAAGNVVPGDDEPITADETGSVGPAPLSLFSSAGNIPDGVYTITFSSASVAATAGLVTVGNCDVPVVPVVPAAVVPAAPQLANTGSSDAGILVGGSALLLLVGAALVVARRRQNADA